MTKSKNKEVKGVTDDVRAVVEGLDPAVRNRWFRYVPQASSSKKNENYTPISSPEKSPKKTKTSKRKADTVKAEATEYTLESDSSVEILDNSPRPKKKKRSKVPAAASDDDDPVEMVFCVYVETPAPAILNVRKGNQKPLPPKTTTLGPYEFISSISYPDFLRVVADGCRTKPANLDRNSMQWKYDRPASAKPKPLTNETGFTVMIKQLKARHKDYAFNVFMSPPNAVKEELPWIRLGAEQDDGNDGGGPPDFDYNIDDLKAGGSVLSIRDQIAGIDSASNEQFNQLLEKYPINNSPLFPGKRIYHNETGYFDLTDIKLRVWAVAMAKGQATIDKAPASSHFFKSQIIRPKNVSAVPELSVPSFDPLVNMFMMNPMLQMMNNPQNPAMSYPPYPYMQHPHHAPPHHYGYPALPPAPAPALAPQPQPQPVVLPREIMLDEYCDRYAVNADDRRVLTELGYTPGDEGLLELDASVWATTKVLPLAKGRILRQHAKFIRDVSEGLWS
ncbi:hypothetical protein DFH09DRAFT_1381957 [Mycena vulgaris]|nr:hypothetical protein DFH09DRAFT_1381957 [Mycena vulgaris]